MELLTRKLCQQIIESGIAYGKTKADGIEITIEGEDSGATRFAKNQITQNLADESMEIAVRVLVAGRQVRLSSDHHLTPIRLRQLIDRAIDQAKFRQEDPFTVDMATPEEVPAISHFDEKTSKMGPAERGEAVAQMIAEAEAAHLVAAGFYQTLTSIEAIGNSNGLFVYDRSTEAQCSVTVTGETEQSGWAKADAVKVSEIDHVALVRKAIETAKANVDPIVVKPGRKTVILEPAAVLDLVCFLFDDLSATGFIDRDSCFVDKLGHKVVGDNITIRDDAFHPQQWGAPFDGEGLPKQPITLIENGVLKGLAVGRRSSKILGLKATGSGAQQPSDVDEAPINFVIEGGDTSIEDMIKSTDDGLLIKRVWYVRDVDSDTKLLTGMTRDGVFLIENGKVTRPVRNLRFNQSVIEMLRNVVALGRTVATSGEETFPAVVPPMKVNNFHFSARTKF